jgi:hypothetical protein
MYEQKICGAMTCRSSVELANESVENAEERGNVTYDSSHPPLDAKGLGSSATHSS